jgi:RNA polymerase sigma-70 factor (ECF subfamily)
LELADAFERARVGDEDAFRVLYRAVQPGLLRYLRVLVGDDAEEIASQAWPQVVRDLKRFRGDAVRLRARCLGVARSLALDHLRGVRQHPVTPADPTPPSARTDTTPAALSDLDTFRALI